MTHKLPHPSSEMVRSVRNNILAITPEWYRALTATVDEADELAADVAALEALFSDGTWVPTVTFTTPGDLVVAYSERFGDYFKIGRFVFITFGVILSTFTHGTASGILRITGVPFTPFAGSRYYGASFWSGITKAGYTDLVFQLNGGDTFIKAWMFASASSGSDVTTADMPTGGSVALQGSLSFLTA